MEENVVKKQISFKLLSIILAIIIVLLITFIIIDKTSKKPPKDEISSSLESKMIPIDLDSQVIKDLIYPIGLEVSIFQKNHWDYRDFKLSDFNTNYKMHHAISTLNQEQKDSYDKHSSTSVRNTYRQIFGPDAEYNDADVEDYTCGTWEYDSKSEQYTFNGGCGVEGWIPAYDSVYKVYKADSNGDYLYVYHDYLFTLKDFNDIYYFFNKYPELEKNYETFGYEEDEDFEFKTHFEISKGKDLTNEFAKLIKENKTNKYKFTFKKQSDGKYYFESGENIK